jgi:small subunit ribosomal protein S5
MPEEKKQQNNKPASQPEKKQFKGQRSGGLRRSFREKREEQKDDFEQKILDLARVTRVMAGGKRMRFRACVAVGDKKGHVSIGVAKGADVTVAVSKAVNKAKKEMIEVPMINSTIPHEVCHKLGAAKILFKPAKKGRGIIAGGVVRVVLELAGVHNITSKILGTSNKLNNAKCTVAALKKLKKINSPVITGKQISQKDNKKDSK